VKYTILAIILCLFATVKVIADVLGFERLSALAAVTNVAPAMKVFTAQKGYETYSSKFELTISYSDGQTVIAQLNPRKYSGLRGPYNRRNVYGALIAYGPVLVSNPKTHSMWKAMANRSFCGESSVLSELGFNNNSGISSATIRYLGQVKTEGTYPTELSVTCG
jgi:hypothetical protein